MFAPVVLRFAYHEEYFGVSVYIWEVSTEKGLPQARMARRALCMRQRFPLIYERSVYLIDPLG